MESTKLTKVKISTLRWVVGSASAPDATPSGSLGSLAFLPSSFLGARLRPSARSIVAGSGLACAPSSLGAFGRLVPSFPLRPRWLNPLPAFSTPQPCGVFVVGLLRRYRSVAGAFGRYAPVSPRGVSAFGGLASAWAVALRASLCPVQR